MPWLAHKYLSQKYCVLTVMFDVQNKQCSKDFVFMLKFLIKNMIILYLNIWLYLCFSFY